MQYLKKGDEINDTFFSPKNRQWKNCEHSVMFSFSLRSHFLISDDATMTISKGERENGK